MSTPALTLGQLTDLLYHYLPQDEGMTLEALMSMPVVFQSLDELDMTVLNIYIDKGKINFDVGND